ncbi:DeoR family transcriptional regulator [Candidatus Peregrinibacteria bacterium]|jgi:heat-inducible transcriptional repressor|nr:DeoR family transcriptional regulator [Candidatus Peregrinibacteria bacterium]MBT4632091.1 DeoR family transcriptional regulator [Candidatus Peregrinibacteria bacterium]MBT5516605.1 DeoR family transcriptional regulator [Candidatus Peregrinibacteria bacterium]MBT5823509.1 DeoR family transcriptional regulator [Candidatus Peregrinibacteria bacterium]
MSDERKNQILSAIIEHFIETAQPVGSKTIILSYNFNVSPATVRSDMATLEKEGMLTHPHTSSGRIPTDKGYRMYVDELADYQVAEAMARETLQSIREEQKTALAKQHVHAAVNLLSQASPNMVFATIPENNRTFFMGFSKMLKQPEFLEAPMQASQVMEVIEDRQHFLNGLAKLNLKEKAQILIGEENILEGIDSCSLIVTEYNFDGFKGAIGILGPKRMPYALNSALLTEVRNLLQNHEL